MPANIPATLASGLREIAALPDTIFDELVRALRALPVEIKQYRVFNEADFELRDLADKGRSVKSAAFSLLLSRARSRTTVNEFVTELSETISSSTGFDPGLVKRLKTRALILLNIKSLDLVARAHDVLLEQSKAFSTARVISDIRPVFGDDVASQPLGAVLVHMLSIVYQSAAKRENFVVALDEKDIDQLISVLERAKTKGNTLKDTIDNTDLQYVRVV